jgi:hypothetical protein
MAIAPPRLTVAWDVFAWIGHRRFARHWCVPQICGELCDSHRIKLSEDAIEDYVRRYATMVAARHGDAEELRKVYAPAKSLILSIDGIQPEKGHETLYVVRELTQKRVWFAESLLSSTNEEVRRLLERAKSIAEALERPVAGWISDKQEAFVQGISTVFPQMPHGYCKNHFLRDLARPVLEMDSHAKVQMRRKVRGLRAIQQEVLHQRAKTAVSAGKQALETPPQSHPRAEEIAVAGLPPAVAVPSSVAGLPPAVAVPSSVVGLPPAVAVPSSVAGLPPAVAVPSSVAGLPPAVAVPSSVVGLPPAVAVPSSVAGLPPAVAVPSSVAGLPPAVAAPPAGTEAAVEVRGGCPAAVVSTLEQPAAEPSDTGQVVLDYCAVVRSILNDDQGGPLHPPGLRMAGALREVRQSLRRCVGAKKGGPQRSSCTVSRHASIEG